MNRALLITVLLSGSIAQAQLVGPSSFSYEGRVMEGSSPSAASVTFLLRLMDPAGTCVIYEERIGPKSLGDSSGYFSVSLGEGTRNTAVSTVGIRSLITNSSSSIQGKNPSDLTTPCTYTPAAGDSRRMRVSIEEGSIVTALSPDITLGTAPYSMVADTLRGYEPASFLQVNSDTTQVKADTVFNSTNWPTLQSLLAGNYIKVSSNGASLPGLAADPSSLSAGQMWYDTTAKTVKYYNGTAVQTIGNGGSITGSSITSGTIGGTTAINTTGTITSSGAISASDFSGKQLNLYNSSGVNKVSVLAPSGLASNYALTLPLADGTNGQVLSTNGAGQLSWINNGVGGSGVSSLNGSTASTQSFGAPGVTGTSPNWSTNAGTGVHTLNIPMASAAGVAAGLISNSEYSSLATKAYCDANLASKILPTPAVGQNGQSIRWNNASGQWEYFTPSAGGAINSVGASAPLLNTGTAADPVIGLNIGAGLVLSSGSLVPAFGTSAGTVAQGNDPRFNPAFSVGDAGKYSRLNDIGSGFILRTAAEVRTDIGLGTAATANTSDILLASNAFSEISGAGAIARSTARANLGITTIGDTIATAANAAAVNTALGVKSAGLLDVGVGLTTSGSTLVPNFGTTVGTVAAGDDSRFGNALKLQGYGVSPSVPSNGQVLTWNGSSWQPQAPSAGPWSVAGSDIYFSTGKVGIGATSPIGRLQVNQTTTSGPAVVAVADTDTQATYQFNKGNLGRWQIRYDSSNEAGSDSGGNLSIFGHNDSGGQFGYPWMTIRRNDGAVGIGGVSNPVYSLTLRGDNSRTIGMERNPTASAGGQDLTIQAGTANTSASSIYGGNLILNSGVSKGTGVSNIMFQTSPGISAAGTDNPLTPRMIITGAGNVGIGTTTPATKLSIQGSDEATRAEIVNTTSTSFLTPGMNLVSYSGTTGGYPTFDIMTARGSKGAPGAVMANDVLGTISGRGWSGSTFLESANIMFMSSQSFTTASSPGTIVFSTTGASMNYASEKMRITQDGNVGIGFNAPTVLLHVGSASVTPGVAVAKFQSGTGTCTLTPASTGTGIACSSDERLKKAIENVTGDFALEKLLQIQAVSYEFRKGVPGVRHTGYIAQRLREVAPEFVREDDDGLLQVYYDGLIPWITEAIKELHANFQDSQAETSREIASLKTENEKLSRENEAKAKEIAELKARMDRIEKMIQSK